jgi:hypothetical protein
MKKMMINVKEYINKLYITKDEDYSPCILVTLENVIEVIKQVQKDAIEYALNEAARNVKAGYMIAARNENIEVIIDKNSILSLKNKLFKEVDDE